MHWGNTLKVGGKIGESTRIDPDTNKHVDGKGPNRDLDKK